MFGQLIKFSQKLLKMDIDMFNYKAALNTGK